jgi:octaprenyl-diphosphate synthase
LKIVSEAVREMSEGELLQIEKARRLDITEEIYFEIIRQKTASLIASCCAIGAASAGAGEDLVQQMHAFGEKVGMAFQIKDDLFDFGDEEIGKPVGIDIKERKMTLPLIYALNNASWAEKKTQIFRIKNLSNRPKEVRKVIDFVKGSGGIEYATKVMEQYVTEAMAILEALPPSNYRTSLEQIVHYTIDRKK